jgi:site-specific DNA-adenine methylase
MNLFNLDLIELMTEKNKIEIKKYTPTALGSEEERYRLISMTSPNHTKLADLLYHRRHTAVKILEHNTDNPMRDMFVKYLEMIENEIKKALILE